MSNGGKDEKSIVRRDSGEKFLYLKDSDTRVRAKVQLNACVLLAAYPVQNTTKREPPPQGSMNIVIYGPK